MRRRDFLRAGTAMGGALFGVPLWASQATNRPKSPRGIVHVVLFSNFEGTPQDPYPTIEWFENCTSAHPSVRWTHLYNPRHLLVSSPGMVATEAGFSPYLLDLQARRAAEVGVHAHMFYDMVEAMGVSPRAYPFVSDPSPTCDSTRTIAEDTTTLRGYDGLMTVYSAAEREQILVATLRAFEDRGFRRPTTFCPGYSATDPALQALLVKNGFTASFAAQIGFGYPPCWDRLLDWSGNITPLTVPYRVNRNTILPPPHVDPQYLELIEVPLNMGVDAKLLDRSGDEVSRTDMFDRHHDWATSYRGETAVALGAHTDVIVDEAWGSGEVALQFDELLSHIEQRAAWGGAEIRYSTASELVPRFLPNKTLGQLP